MLNRRVSCVSWKYVVAIIVVGAGACEAVIRGDVTYGNDNIFVEPFLIDAGIGRTIIGNGNIVHATAAILNKSCGLLQSIGNGNIFYTNTTCESLQVGNGNIMEPDSSISQGIILGNGCTVHAGCHKTGNINYGNGASVTCP